VIRRSTGRPYETFLREEILAPLGLGETGIVATAEQRQRLAPGHVASLFSLHEARAVFPDILAGDYDWTGGADGALYSSVSDLRRWMEVLAAGRLLSPESVEQMWRPQLSDYARGWVVERLPSGAQLVWHNGELTPLGYQSFLGWFPSRALSVVVVANVDSSALPLTAIVLGELGALSPGPVPRWTLERALVTARVFQVGPLLVALLYASLWLLRRRLAAFPRALAAASTAFGLASVLLAFAPRTTEVWGTALAGAISAGAVWSRRHDRPASARSELGPALVMALLALGMAGSTLWLRFSL
jgi:CubicO group peptidase (beta-lactamase class C family)